MPLIIKNVSIRSLSIIRQRDEESIQCEYALMSDDDRTIAKESVTNKEGYGGNKFVPSAATLKLLAEAVSSYKKDLETSIGL